MAGPMRILYIGDPLGVHDPKWISYFSTNGDVEAHLITYPKEFSKITEADKVNLKDDLRITLHEPLMYYSVLKPHQTYSAVRHLRRIIKDHRIDLVHALFAAPSALWALHVPVPFITTARGSDVLRVIPDLNTATGWHSLADKLLYHRFRDALRAASSITGTSNRQLEKLWQMFGTRKMHLIRTGVDVERIRNADISLLPKEVGAGHFIFLPRFTEPIYNTMLQAEALARLPMHERQGLPIVMIGGSVPEYEQKVLDVLVGAGWEVTVLRNLSQAEMWATFRAARLCMMTPVSDGTPNSALEAMAAGCPNILGAFDYDLDLFGPEFCLRMASWEPEELTGLIRTALTSDMGPMAHRAYDNILKKGNRTVEMEKLRVLYARSLSS